MTGDRTNKNITEPQTGSFQRTPEAIRDRLEKISGIRVDSDQSLREALDFVLNDQNKDMEQKLRNIEASALRKLRKGSGPGCSLCGRSEMEVSQLFAGTNSVICSKCIKART